MATVSKPKATFPGVPYNLQAGDFGYDRGRRFMLEQFDGGQHTFRTRGDMDAFVAIHSFRYIDEEEMARERAAYDSLKDSK